MTLLHTKNQKNPSVGRIKSWVVGKGGGGRGSGVEVTNSPFSSSSITKRKRIKRRRKREDNKEKLKTEEKTHKKTLVWNINFVPSSSSSFVISSLFT